MKLISRALEHDPNTQTMVPAMQDKYLQQVRGPIAVGNCLFLLLDGAALMLACVVWYKRSRALSRRNRMNFRLLLFFNLVCVAFSCEDIYHAMSSNAKTFQDLRSDTIPEALQMFWGGIIALLVQCFLIKRTAVFLKSHKYIAKILYGGAILSFLGVTFVTIENFLSDRSIGPKPLLLAANQMWLWVTAVTDVAISSVLAYKLTSMKSGFRKETDRLLEHVVRVTISSAVPIALFASIAAIVFAATFHTWLFVLYYVFVIPLPALYTLSFLYAISGYSLASESAGAVLPPDHQLKTITIERRASKSDEPYNKSPLVSDISCDVAQTPTLGYVA